MTSYIGMIIGSDTLIYSSAVVFLPFCLLFTHNTKNAIFAGITFLLLGIGSMLLGFFEGDGLRYYRLGLFSTLCGTYFIFSLIKE